jgi:hypothetical protein
LRARQIIPRFCYAWAYLPIIGNLIAKQTLSEPSLLVISFPRSGSSWLGSRLAISSKAAYLREPINTSYLGSGGVNTLKHISLTQPDHLFARSAVRAFCQAPCFDRKIVAYPKQWLPWNLLGKKRLIKEVNPLALEFLIKNFAPLVVFIVRHPCAIAASYLELGWLENADVRDTPNAHGLSAYEVFGRRVGEVFEYAVHALKNYQPRHLIVKYENLVLDELNELERISTFADLGITKEKLEGGLKTSSQHTTGLKADPFSLIRRSDNQNEKWRETLSQHQIALIRRGYLYYAKHFYVNNSDW